MRFLFLLTFLLASGCATLGGTKQYVSIDSEPRGLEVSHVEDEEVLGTTPLFVHLERERSHTFAVRAPGRPSTPASMQCDYRWGTTLGGNVGLAAIGTVPPAIAGLWAAGVGLDLATGAAWACPDTLHVETSEERPAPKRCPVYVVAPPKHEDERISRLLARTWAEQVGESCAKVVDEDTSAALFARFGIDHETGFSLAETPRARLNEIGHRTGATHLVVMQVPSDQTIVRAVTSIHDLHTLALTGGGEVEVDTSSESVATSPVRRWLARHVTLVPNAVAFSAAAKSFDFQPSGGAGPISDGPTASILPSVLANWTMLNVEHPDRHGVWGVSYGLGPGAYLGYNSRALSFEGSRLTEVTAVHAIALYGGSVAFHTPAGAFPGWLGLGGGAALHRADGLHRNVGLRFYAGAEVAWTVFVTERLFVRVAVVTYSPHEPELEGDGYRLEGWDQSSVTIGWFLPSMRTWVRELF